MVFWSWVSGVRGVAFGFLIFVVSSCGTGNSANQGRGVAALVEDPLDVHQREILLDFEKPNPAVEWQQKNISPATAETQAASQSAPPAETISRSSVRPQDGLWSLKARLEPAREGELVHHLSSPRDLGHFDTLSAGIMHTDLPGRSGEWVARLFIVDEEGKKVMGDPAAVTSRWQDLLLDLRTAAEEGADLSRVAMVGVELRNVRVGQGPLDIQTDTWAVGRNFKAYEGEPMAAAKTFYAQREGTRLRVGMAGEYEITFYQRAGIERPWMTVTGGAKRLLRLGQPGTGLLLLDQTGYDALGPAAVRQGAFDAGAAEAQVMPAAGWPVSAGNQGEPAMSQWRWQCVWTSPVAALVEMKQEAGPYDRLGEPAAQLTWRFMIYQWGQVFVHVEWTRGGEGQAGSRPMTWALVSEERAGVLPMVPETPGVQAKTGAGAGADGERLLSAIYPVAVRQGLETALPHQMQTGAAAAMIAKSDAGAAARNVWWWARGNGKRIFGTGLSTTRAANAADCMLLVNAPNALLQAASFGAYLVPPKVKLRQGELDRNFPGDVDNDGLVDSYGFQVIRLAGGRASFMVYPQERPLFYPPYLFTVPAVEREALDLKNSRVLINIDGKQFADPPRFPDGSFLLQLPYVIDRPVSVEAILVKK